MKLTHKHHIIPKHIGGTDEQSNLIELSVEEHANAHKELYEKYNRWQDKVAWQALSGMIGKEEILHEVFVNMNKGKKLTEEHKAKINPIGRKQPDSQKKKVAEKLSKEYMITDPKGNTFKIKNLNQFSRENGLDQSNCLKVAAGICKQHKGYIIKYNY